MRTISLIILLQLLVATTVFGFDGRRTGFVGGLGIGVAPVSSFSIGKFKEDNIAFAFHSFAGHGFDEQNILTLEVNLAHRHSEYYSEIGNRTIDGFFFGPLHGDQNITQGFIGLTWYHYMKPAKKSWFTAFGFGLYELSLSSLGSNDSDIGVLIGGGYEFQTGLRLAGYYTYGKTKYRIAEMTHNQISFLLSYIWY